MTRCTSSRGAAALLLLSSSASSFVVFNNHQPSRTAAALHATTEDFQRSLLAAQIANANTNKRNSSPTKSITTTSQSVDYDAAARLAYESSGSTDDFSTFKLKYLQDTSNLVATKQRTRIAKDKAAAAKEKAQRAAEAAKVAKEKAQAKIKEREDALVAKGGSSPPPHVDIMDVVEETTVTPVPVVVTATTTTTATLEEETSTTSTATDTSTDGRIPRELALVPINDSTIQFTAGALGLTAGLVLGGPLLAIFLSATANYLSRKDDDVVPSSQSTTNDDDDSTATTTPTASSSSPKRIVDAASQTALYLYNFLAQFERDNKIVDNTLQLLESSVSKAKQSSEETGETITAIESTIGGLTKSAQELNDQYDLVGGAGTVLNSVGDLVEDSVDRVIDLNEQFRLTERVGGVVSESVKGAVARVTEKKKD
mmetsp:Transcript_8967/g.12857  ORF Transcript_8967/g.12857 Transcript_8967/m.12857 type:complete len:427 (-) Transcript_8967:99-1379(-)